MMIRRTAAAAAAAADGDGDGDEDAGVSGQAMSPLANQTRLDDIPLAPLAILTRLPLPR